MKMNILRKTLALLVLAVLALFPACSASASSAAVIVPDPVYYFGDTYPMSSSVDDNGTSHYTYSYSYGDSCYKLMELLCDELIESRLFRLVGFSEYGEALFWQFEYVGPGSLPEISTANGKPYHLEIGCASYDWYSTFMSINACDGIIVAGESIRLC